MQDPFSLRAIEQSTKWRFDRPCSEKTPLRLPLEMQANGASDVRQPLHIFRHQTRQN